MNEIVNKSLLAWDEIMPEMHLRQPSALGQPGFICTVLLDHLVKPKK